jgi:hypothetical protein
VRQVIGHGDLAVAQIDHEWIAAVPEILEGTVSDDRGVGIEVVQVAFAGALRDQEAGPAGLGGAVRPGGVVAG